MIKSFSVLDVTYRRRDNLVRCLASLAAPGDVRNLAAAIKEVSYDWRNGGSRFAGGRRIFEEEFDLEKNVAALTAAMRDAVKVLKV